MLQQHNVKVTRVNAWSPAHVSVKFGKHEAKTTCRNEEAARRFIGNQMKMAMEKFISARGHAYAHTGRLSQARFNLVQTLRYRLAASGVWDAKRAAQVFLRSAGDFQQLMPPSNSRLRSAAEELFNDLASYSRKTVSR